MRRDGGRETLCEREMQLAQVSGGKEEEEKQLQHQSQGMDEYKRDKRE